MRKLNLIMCLLCVVLFTTRCGQTTTPAEPVSSSGVQKANVEVQTDVNGHTTEQVNILARYKVDNTVGSIKHLYIISAYSGQVLIYSTVKGKVTSSGKRLTPTSVVDNNGTNVSWDTYGFDVNIGGQKCRTTEVLQDDGTYGNSIEYIFWFDTRGIYHQQYVTGGMLVHISDQPLAVKNIVLNMELTNEK